MTQAEYLAAWRAQVARGKAVHPEFYGKKPAPDWNPPAKRVSE